MDLMEPIVFVSIGISEGLIILLMTLISANLFTLFWKKKSKPLLYLSEGFLFLTIGILINLLAYVIGYFTGNQDKLVYYMITSFAILYFTLTLSNIFIYAFIETVFFTENKQRIFLFSFLEGIALGLILTRVRLLPEVDQLNPIIMLYHNSLSLFTYALLMYLSLRELLKAKNRKAKYGLGLIGGFALMQIFALIILYKGTIYYFYNSTFDVTYVIIFNVLELLTVFLGYLGYVMPKWFTKILKVGE